MKLPRPVKIHGQWSDNRHGPSLETPEGPKPDYNKAVPLVGHFRLHSLEMEFMDNLHSEAGISGVLVAHCIYEGYREMQNRIREVPTKQDGVAVVKHAGFYWTEPLVNPRMARLRTDTNFYTDMADVSGQPFIRGWRVTWNLLGFWSCGNEGNPYTAMGS